MTRIKLAGGGGGRRNTAKGGTLRTLVILVPVAVAVFLGGVTIYDRLHPTLEVSQLSILHDSMTATKNAIIIQDSKINNQQETPEEETEEEIEDRGGGGEEIEIEEDKIIDKAEDEGDEGEDVVSRSLEQNKEVQQPEEESTIEDDNTASHNNYQHKVHFLNPEDVTQQDSFSASWLQSKQDFMEMDLDAVGICEDAAFKAWNTRRDKLRMSLDYLDWSVEHLSKWWKALEFFDQPIVYDSVMTKLHRYITLANDEEKDPETVIGEDPILKTTLVTIAFQPYGAPKHFAKRGDLLPAERAYNLTIVSLAATVESLRRAEMGRILVVGSEDKHEKVAQEAFDYLHKHLPQLPYNNQAGERSFGHLEWNFVKIEYRHFKTKHLERNMPKGCLVGAREVFSAANRKPADQAGFQSMLTEWLGTKHDPHYWQYLYLTEPDSILITRREALLQIKAEVDAGGIVPPFRLQPIAHESDIMGYPIPDRFLHISDGFEEVVELDHTDAAHDVCCDEKTGKGHRPGVNNFPACAGGKKWFMCGFQPTKEPTADRHERLRPYQLFRLTKGTGLTTISGNLFGRRCMPAKNSQCEPYVTEPKKKKKKRKKE